MTLYKWVVSTLFLLFFTVSLAGAAIEPVTLTVACGESDYGDGTAVIPVRISSAQAITAVCFTLQYDTQYLELTSVSSDFFKSFVDQFQAAEATSPGPESVMVDGVSYDRPLVWRESTDTPTGAMIAAVKIQPEAGQGDRLMALHFKVKGGTPGERYPIRLVPSVVTNSEAGYPAEGETVAMVRGYELSEGLPLSLPEVVVSSVAHGAVTLVDNHTTPVSGTLTVGGVAVAHTEITLFSAQTDKSWVVVTDGEGYFTTDISTFSADSELTVRFNSPVYGDYSGVVDASGGHFDSSFTNTKPDKPVLTLAAAVELSLTPTFTGSDFSDANHGHAQSQWEMVDKTKFDASGRAEDSLLAEDNAISEDRLAYVRYQALTDVWLTTLEVPDYVLEAGTTYMARVRYVDNCGTGAETSEWSDFVSFTTAADPDGYTAEQGAFVPSMQVLTEAEKEGFSQGAVCLKTIPDESTKALCVAIQTPGDGVVKMVSTRKTSELGAKALASMPESLTLPYGLVGFSLTLRDDAPVDGVVTVTLEFSDALEAGYVWWKYNQATDSWEDYSAHALFAEDRRSITLELQDGGFGDFDGVKNGRILDPGGAGVQVAAPVDDKVNPANDNADPVNDDSGSGGGCFIGSARY